MLHPGNFRKRWINPAIFPLAALLTLTGCNQYGFRYKPAQQPPLNPIFVDYRSSADTVRILVDTNGQRLEEIHVLNADGISVAPQKIDYPEFEPLPMSGTDLSIRGPSYAQAPTVAYFSKDDLGSRPWNVEIKVRGVRPVEVRVGG